MRTREELNKYMRGYLKKKRIILKKQGICVNCRKNKVQINHVSCSRCLLDKRLRTTFRTSSEHIEHYKKLLEKQNGRCAICNSFVKKLLIDHKHGTDKIRGLLCSSCNIGIGMLMEDPTIMTRAIEYVK